MATNDKDRLAELIAQARAQLAAVTATPAATTVPAAPKVATSALAAPIPAPELPDSDVSSAPVTASEAEWLWNPEQHKAIDHAAKGESFNLIGAAGTGKTTTLKEIVRILVSKNKVPMIDISTKYLMRGLPGIVLTSFTRRAVRNIRRVVSDDLKPHCVTLHKLLEFEPVFYEVWDAEAGKNRITMRFEPQRNMQRKLPETLRTVVIDEGSMPSTTLFKMLWDALPEPKKVQFIFVGDLHQLPPVYGQAILGFKLLELPTVELTRIYRQAAKSPIITLAHKVKNGEKIPVTTKTTVETEQGKVTIHPWKKPLSDFDGAHATGLFLKQLITSGNYDEEEDIILCPQEKVTNLAFGTKEFNRIVAQELGNGRKAIVFEIVAGFQRHYYAVGDRVMVGREDAIITKIEKNARYWSTVRPRPASEYLDRWGNYKQKPVEDGGKEDFDVDAYLDNFTLKGTEEEDRKQEASHVITVNLLDTEVKQTVSGAGDINNMMFAYCLTVHKAQGSEWSRVFFLTHQSHITMWSRELLYTAITRARKELYMIVEPDRGAKDGTLTKAARSPRIKGDTLAEKAEFFKGKQEEFDKMMAKGSDVPAGKVVEGKYKGTVEEKKPIAIAPSKPIVLVRMADLVPSIFKDAAQQQLLKRWERAKLIWGDKIGAPPTLDYNLQRSNIIGLADLQNRVIKLNPVWCILAVENPVIKEEMLGDTLDHEICHIVSWTYSTDRGHDSGWRMAMRLMGREPKQFYDHNTLPAWTSSFAGIVESRKKQLAESEGANVADDYNITTTDQI